MADDRLQQLADHLLQRACVAWRSAPACSATAPAPGGAPCSPWCRLRCRRATHWRLWLRRAVAGQARRLPPPLGPLEWGSLPEPRAPLAGSRWGRLRSAWAAPRAALPCRLVCRLRGRHRRLRSRRMHGAGRRLGHLAWRRSNGGHLRCRVARPAPRARAPVRPGRLWDAPRGAEQGRQGCPQDLGSRKLDLVCGSRRLRAVALAGGWLFRNQSGSLPSLPAAAGDCAAWDRGCRLGMICARRSEKSSSSACPRYGPAQCLASLAGQEAASSPPYRAGWPRILSCSTGAAAGSLAASLPIAPTGSGGSTPECSPGCRPQDRAYSYQTPLVATSGPSAKGRPPRGEAGIIELRPHGSNKEACPLHHGRRRSGR